MQTIIVSGALANKYRNGGEAWVRLSWIMGMRRLGFDVHFVEQIAPHACLDENGGATSLADSVNLKYFRSVIDQFGLSHCATLISEDGQQCGGSTWDRLLDIADSAELLVNISGHGLLDLGAYRRFADGEMESVTADEDNLSQSLSALEEFNQRIAGPAEAT